MPRNMKTLIAIIATILLSGCSVGFGSASKFEAMCNRYDMKVCGGDTNYMHEMGVTDIGTLEMFYVYSRDAGDTWEPVRDSDNGLVGDCEDIAISIAELLFDDADSIILYAGRKNGKGHAWVSVDGVIYDFADTDDGEYFGIERIVIK